MKTLMESINESVLDSDKLIGNAEEAARKVAAISMFNELEMPVNKDALGRTIAPGDYVLYIPSKWGTSGRQSFKLGIVQKITAKQVKLLIQPVMRSVQGTWVTPNGQKMLSHEWEQKEFNTTTVPAGFLLKIEESDLAKVINI